MLFIKRDFVLGWERRSTGGWWQLYLVDTVTIAQNKCFSVGYNFFLI
jgi:hypothetical protein